MNSVTPMERSDLRVIFMGTPEFAVPSLDAILEAGYQVPLVVSVPDRRRGRGRQLHSSAVKSRAVERGIDVVTPEDLKDPEFIEQIKGVKPDIICVVAFRILPQVLYEIPARGSFNLHGSLLPAFRGAAPINRALMAGEEKTGVTTFFLQKRVDTGAIIMQREIDIEADMTAGELHDVMMRVGAEVVVETLDRIAAGSAEGIDQDDALASPAPKIFPDDCSIDWTRSAEELHNHVRGLSPYPGAWTTWEGRRLKVLRSALPLSPVLTNSNHGVVVLSENRLYVQTGDGMLELLELQLAGKRSLSVEDFLAGYRSIDGTELGATPVTE